MPVNTSHSTTVRHPKRFWRVLLLIVMLLGAGVYWLLIGRAQLFIWTWTDRLQALGSFAAVQNYSQSHPTAPLYIHNFPSGEWVAVVMEHACCTGAGFNATIFYDSSGSTYFDTTKSFCGVEGLGEELHRVEADSLVSFYPKLTQLKLQKR